MVEGPAQEQPRNLTLQEPVLLHELPSMLRTVGPCQGMPSGFLAMVPLTSSIRMHVLMMLIARVKNYMSYHPQSGWLGHVKDCNRTL